VVDSKPWNHPPFKDWVKEFLVRRADISTHTKVFTVCRRCTVLLQGDEIDITKPVRELILRTRGGLAIGERTS